MRPARPRTLIQIHYHNRPGGVNTAMAQYSTAFWRATRGEGRSIMLCRDYRGGAGDGGMCEVRSLPQLDYRQFRSARTLAEAITDVYAKLVVAIDDPALERPLCVIAHNPNLGKNCALSAALALIVRERGNMPGAVRFRFVVHDRAEEGRLPLLNQLRMLEGWGYAVWNMLYPDAPTLAYVTPSHRTAKTLRRAGLPVHLLFNPILALSQGASGMSARERMRIARWLSGSCPHGGELLDASRPTAFYPARVIGRKNPVEAVLVACVLMKHNLVMGAVGTSQSDRALSRALRSLCERYRFPVLLDVEGQARPRERTCSEPLFADLYRYADVCASTSILEGFGYGLYEPYAYGRALVGRRPDGFVPFGGVRHAHLYDELLLPRDWVDAELLAAKTRGLVALTPRRTRSHWTWEHTDRTDGRVDFGALDWQTQIRVLARLAERPSLARALRFARHGRLQPAAPDGHVLGYRSLNQTIAHNRAGIRKELGSDRFQRSFERSFLSCAGALRSPRRVRRKAIWSDVGIGGRPSLLLAGW
jgi:hypothetical protein